MPAKFAFTKRAVQLALTLLAIATVLAACAGATPAPTPAPAPTQPPAPTQAVAPTQPPAPTTAPTQAPAPTQVPATTAPTQAGGPQRGGVLRQAYVAPANLDPAFLSSIADDEIARQWGDFLVYTGENLQADPSRSLAEKWETSSDGLTWTFHLRQGVKFSNGNDLTSKDVKATFDRLRDKAVGAATVQLYATISNVTTPDDSTVVFTLTQPNTDLPLDLGDYHAIIEWNGIKDYKKEFIGTGPFIIDTYLPEDRITFKRNPNYWMKAADGQSLPYLDGLQFIFNSDASAQVEALRGGQVDYLFYLPSEYVKTLQQDKNIVVYQAPSNLTYVVRMRSDRKPFSDNNVRMAFKLAVDRTAILNAAFNGLGVTGRDTPIGPAYADYYLNVPEPTRDVAKAKQLLAAAGYPNGLKVQLVTQQTSPVPAMATILQQQLADAGITVEIQPVTPDVYYGANNMWLEADFAITDWGARAYPQPYLDLAYVCNAKWNESHWCDQELDSLSKQAAAETDHAKRVDLYKKIQQIFIDRGPIIVPFFANGLWAASAKLQGLKPTGYLGTALDLRTVYFQK